MGPGLVLTLAALLLPAPVSAQVAAGGRPSEAQMGELMEAMQGVQACMADVDRAALEQLQRRMEQEQAEMQRLCRAGQEGAARARALALGQELAADPAFNAMQTCLARLPRLPMLQSALPFDPLIVEYGADAGADDGADGDDRSRAGTPRSLCDQF